jgi:hypothetical protein
VIEETPRATRQAELTDTSVMSAAEEILKRVRSIELTGSPERLRSNFFNGVKLLPVRVET